MYLLRGKCIEIRPKPGANCRDYVTIYIYIWEQNVCMYIYIYIHIYIYTHTHTHTHIPRRRYASLIPMPRLAGAPGDLSGFLLPIQPR